MRLFSLFNKLSSESGPHIENSEFFRRAAIKVFSVVEDSQAVYVSDQQPVTILPSFVADFVSGCEKFRPFEEHLRRYASYHQLDLAELGSLKSWLPQLLDAGLFISTAQLREACSANSDSSSVSPARITSIGFPTRNRVKLLQRGMESFILNAKSYGRDLDFIVADNSSNPKAVTSCKEMLEAIQRQHNVRCYFAGEQEKKRFAKALASLSEVHPETIDFALFNSGSYGFAGGANRNALLLQEAGNVFSSVDDDALCDLALAPQPRTGLTLFSDRDGFERYFFATSESAFRAAAFVEKDYCAMHEELLGKPVGSIVAEAKGELHFEKISDELLGRLQTGKGRILSTFAGVVGDPGIPTAYFYLGYRGDSFGRLTKSEDIYRTSLRSRAVHATLSGLAISDASISPGFSIGFDGRELLPPFLPVLHTEDFVYGATLWKCCPHAFLGHLPYALRHEPPAGRSMIVPGDLSPENRVVIWDFGHIVRKIILEYWPRPGENTAAIRMRGVGRHLREIADTDFATFVEFLRLQILHHESLKIGYLEHRLKKEAEAPDFWRKDVEAYLQHTREALTFDDFDIPLDWKNKTDADSARREMQRLLLQFGQLLEVWPDLIEAAKQLRERGEPLAARIEG
jgi:hypothetical protein